MHMPRLIHISRQKFNKTAMAESFNIFVVLTIITPLALFSLCSARNLRFPSLGANYTKVCASEHFAKHGLEMSHFHFCDSSLPFEVRANDLVARMTLEEKVAQMGNKAVGVPRIGLPYYEWWSEALHGVSNIGPGTYFDDEVVPGSTSFPPVILTAASFNKTLWKAIGQAVSTEARAMHNLGRAGLTFWSPNINPVRDPRWGRITETPGEDPYTVGMYAVNYVRGLQDVEEAENNVTNPNSRPLKVSSCCKHYVAYDVDNWLGVDRYHYNAKVAEQDMVETFLRPFEMCVKDGDVSSVMCSYNQVNSYPTCADVNLLKNKLRGEWKLNGYIVSDCDSLEVMVDNQKFLSDSGEDAVAQTLKAGLDLDCGDFYPKYLYNAVMQGKVKEADIDVSLSYLYQVLMRLGFFDGDKYFKSLGAKDVCSVQNIKLAREAAREGIVLLKNDDATLPLNFLETKSLALIGPHANATAAMIGNYAGVPCRMVSPLDAFSEMKSVLYESGCADVKCKDDTMIFPAIKAANVADATLLFVGLDLSIEAESLDRIDLLLPGYQTDLINQVAASSKGPVIVVIMSAGGVDISFAKDNPNIKAILWAGFPGEQGGNAIADVFFGKYNPGGRLPITWYGQDYIEKLPMTSMALRPNEALGYPGRTYKFYDGPTVYPFGYGLSYTKFELSLSPIKHSELSMKLTQHQHCHRLSYTKPDKSVPCPAILVQHSDCSHTVSFEVAVKNMGRRDGSEVVIVYAVPPQGIHGTLLKQVVAFERVFVQAGKTAMVKFEVNACKSLKIVDASGYELLPSGEHKIVVRDDKLSFPVGISFQQ